MDVHLEMLRKVDQMWEVEQVGGIQRLSFLWLLILRLCCHRRCGAFHFLTADFHGWVLAIAWPHGELDQPGGLTWKLTLGENQIDFCWINDSVTHCMLLELIERRRSEIGGRPSMRYKGSSITSLFPAHTWLWNCRISVNRMNTWGFYLFVFFLLLYFYFFLWFPILHFVPVLPKDTAFAWILTWLPR